MSTATGSLATDLALIDATLERLGKSRLGGAIALESGRNHNYRVDTGDGPVCLRLHRHTRSRERIELGLAALHHASENGIPVAAPISADGVVLFEVAERLTSAYPWIEARSHQRFAIDAADAPAIGALHGRLVRALADFQHPGLAAATELSWDTGRSLAELQELAAILERDGVHGFDTSELLDDIDRQRAHLESGALRGPSDFEGVPRQPIHGDVHEGNVLLAADGTVAAVIDWDMVALGPPLYEVIRAVDFNHALDDPAALDGYLRAYAAEAPYAAAEAVAMVELWASSTIHNTWSLRTLLLEGDHRVAPFIPLHRERIRQFTDPAYRDWLTGRFRAHAAH